MASSEEQSARRFRLADKDLRLAHSEAATAGLLLDLRACYRCLFDHRFRASGKRTQPSKRVETAFTRIESWYQETLREAEEDSLAGVDVNTHWRAVLKENTTYGRVESVLRQHQLVLTHRLALEAYVTGVGTRAQAKRIQLEVSEQLPLALCYGEPTLNVELKWPWPSGPHRHVFQEFRSGCGAIFVDPHDPLLRGRTPFATYCPVCRDKKIKRSAETAVRRRLKNVR
jgi:hypothetical protein